MLRITSVRSVIEANIPWYNAKRFTLHYLTRGFTLSSENLHVKVSLLKR